MFKISSTLEYWDWLIKSGYSEKDCSNRSLLNEFYHNVFHLKYPEYTVNGFEYFTALGVI